MAAWKDDCRVITAPIGPKDQYYLVKRSRENPEVSIDDELLGSRLSRLDPVRLCTAISEGCSLAALKSYLQWYRESANQFSRLMHIITPVLYYAIDRNFPEAVAILLEYGVHPDGKDTAFIPPLAFAVIHGQLHLQDMTDIVRLLLEAGADPFAIPKDMWTKYLDKPSKDVALSGQDPNWWNQTALKYLASGLSLTQRYYLYRAAQAPNRNQRTAQLARLLGVSELLKMQYRIIGQPVAIDVLEKKVLNRIASNVDSPEPLVLIFAGPPGHGKTELAKRFGDLLSVKYEYVPCQQMSTDTKLLGSKQGYERSREGAPLNNHLSSNDGSCSVAFLDEFDKTSSEACTSLLTIFSEGHHINRRTNRPVDCRQTIWILASNLGDEAIARFYDQEMKDRTDQEKVAIDLSPLTEELRELFRDRFGDPFESRVDHIVPFFPFTFGEQAVVGHKFLHEFAGNVRKDIDLRPEVKRHMGHSIISFQDDGKLCGHMAQREYRRSTGARGLKREATSIGEQTREVYNEISGEVTEGLNDGPCEQFEVKLMPVTKNKDEVKVFRVTKV